MREGDELIQQMNKDSNPWWSTDRLRDFIKKPLSIDGDGNVTLNGTYTFAEIDAIVIAAANERCQMKIG
jgi:hypothetical protein